MNRRTDGSIRESYQRAREAYARNGVDTERVLRRLAHIPLSLNCWQGDDVAGFERGGGTLAGGGIQATGNYPGKARTAKELRSDAEQAFSLIPGPHRFNLHAIYGEFSLTGPADRDRIGPEHFEGWVQWARRRGYGLDFNATFFAHPKAGTFTLSSKDQGIRRFWIEHARKARAIASWMGRRTGKICTHNLWIPDGFKDTPADAAGHRALLKDSLDQIYRAKYPLKYLVDSLESKLFGIGLESCTVGSHEFYMGYVLSRPKRHFALCLDFGHFHPTESVADKVSALLLYTDRLLLHVSRGVRWDSDHVAVLSDELVRTMTEVAAMDALDRVFLALDYFDASINRVGAWVTGSRATLQAVLLALLQPHRELVRREERGDGAGRLALMELTKTLPWGAVWDRYCQTQDVPVGRDALQAVEAYEKDVLNRRR